MVGIVASPALSTARSSKFRETSENGFMHVISGTVQEGRLKVAYASTPGAPRVLYAVDVGRAERDHKLKPKSMLWSKVVSLEFQCSKGIPCKFASGEAEIVLRPVPRTKVAICLVKEYSFNLHKWWHLHDYMILQVQMKTFAKQRKKREYPESEHDSYGTDGETAGCMGTSAKFQNISQDHSAYNHWVGQMRLQLKTFAKQRKKQEYPESEHDSYGTDGETAGCMATSAKFQNISQDQSANNHWVGQMRLQLKTFAKQCKKRQYPEPEQTDSYGTDGETAGCMGTSAKFQSISQDQSAYNHWVGHPEPEQTDSYGTDGETAGCMGTSAKFQSISQDQSAYNHWVGQMRLQLKTFAKQCKKRQYPEPEQTDSYGTDGETAGCMGTSAKFQSISQDQSAYNHWVGQMRLQLKTFAKQCKKRQYPEPEQTDSYGTDGETAGRMATSAKFQSISQDQSAYNHWVGQMRLQLKTFAKQCKKRQYPEPEHDSYGTNGETAGRMATSAKFQSISQDQSAYNHWVGQMRLQLKTLAKQCKKRQYPEPEHDSYGTNGETAGRMATSAKFQSISQDQSAYNHWVGQMRLQLKTLAKQCKKRQYPEPEHDSYGTNGETAGRMATSAKFQSISQDQSAYNHWVGQMRLQLKTLAKQCKKRQYPEPEHDSYGTNGETAGRMATSAKFQSISQDQSAYNHSPTPPDSISISILPDPDPEPSKSKCCCCVVMMVLFVVLVLAVTLAAWDAEDE